LKKIRDINRRDFINGFALSIAAGSSLSPLEILANQKNGLNTIHYPPALMGMRGSNPGSFEVAHALAWGGAKFNNPKYQTDDDYDLVVVGGGISGLSAAYFFQQRYGNDAKILILDNHDDFGGHARRNEFNVDGEELICYGGSQSIDTPSGYSSASKQLLQDLDIYTDRFYEYYDQGFFDRHNLKRGIHFSRHAYTKNVIADDILRQRLSSENERNLRIIDSYPIKNESKKSLISLLKDKTDHLQHIESQSEKIRFLRKTSYSDFLNKHLNIPQEITKTFRDQIKGLWGVGWDALSTMEAFNYDMPGTEYLEFEIPEDDPSNTFDSASEKVNSRDEPYIFHFPDGNASIPRCLVRKLIPRSIPGKTMEDIVKAKVDYDLLDEKNSKVRLRLNSTAVNVQNTSDGNNVDIKYINMGTPYRVRGRHVVMACYNNMLPYLCPEITEKQNTAIKYATKIPLVYISVAVRNWHAFNDLGYHSFYIPQSKLMHSFGMDFPVSMGGYNYTSKPSQATVLHGTFVPTDPDIGLSQKEQAINGRRKLYDMSFENIENLIYEQLDESLGMGGFDVEQDISGITVNRWPHGYSWEYNDYSDPVEYTPYNGPHIEGRKKIGRISIANSDASAYAYVDGAIDAADRAVNEQLKK